MGRPVNHVRRSELLESAVTYVIDYGLADLSLRPMAAALGVTPTTLVHHFGTKDELLEAILNRVRERIFEAIDVPDRTGADAASLIRDAWAWSSDPRHRALFRLFFEVYGRALQQPDRFASFLERVIEDWLDILTASFEHQGEDPVASRRQATHCVAVFRGLLLDLLTTGDAKRVNDALDAFIAELSTAQLSSRP
jgi:AcrR family transcriptional regulator